MTEASGKETASKNKVTGKAKGKSLVKSQSDQGKTYQNLLLAHAAITVVILITLIALWLSFNQSEEKASSQDQAAMSQFEQLQQKIAQTDAALLELQDRSEMQLEQQKNFNDVLQALQKERPDTEQDWTLREVEYLVLIAMRRLQLERDVDTAIAALKTADERIVALANPALIPLREQIAADINALSTSGQIDTTAKIVYLTDMQSRITALPLKAQFTQTASEMNVDKDKPIVTEGSGWRELPGLVWKELKSLVVIKHKDAGGAAFLMPNEEYFLFQNLKLELANARLSVLRVDTEAMQSSLDLIMLWIKENFDQESTAVQNTLLELEKIRKNELKPVLPDISATLQGVRQIIATE